MRQLVSFTVMATLAAACGGSPGEVTSGSSSEPALPPSLARSGQSIAPRRIVPAFTPIALDAKPVTVMLRMEAEPITLVQARTLGRKLTLVERGGVRSDLVSRQQRLQPDLEALGASVVRGYQNAYNGLTVRVARKDLGKLAALPGVTGVYPLQPKRHDNTLAVPFVAARSVWAPWPAGLRGENIKVAVLDTGIDYTHANFGGPGTPEAYASAHAAETLAPDPAWFGPRAPRIKGGIDLVGDAYDPESEDPEIATPRPDSNPLDCDGHGSHVAGTLGGSGVTTRGRTYTGPYDASTYGKAFRIGPGVAPRVDLYAVRVFGCVGATLVEIDAIEWAVDNDMDVINMSLGSQYGRADDPSAEAASNAVKAGVIVVAASGNSGSVPYVTGSPASGDGVLSVAATDARPELPGATLRLNGSTITVQNSNGATFSNRTRYPVVVLGTPDALGFGCSPEDYDRPDIAGALVVALRGGGCFSLDRAQAAQAAGAAAVALVNDGDGYPPSGGALPGITIPFFGVTPDDAPALVQSSAARASNVTIDNAAYRARAPFSSTGSRFGDSALKPNLLAPGVAVVSTAVGTGSDGVAYSGTSMATPVVAGLAALTRQAHPQWSAAYVAAALSNTANPRLLGDYAARSAGAGVPQAPAAVATRAVATSEGEPTVSVGFLELRDDVRQTREIKIRNLDRSAVTFNVVAPSDLAHGVAHSVATPRRVQVPGLGSAVVRVTFRIAGATPADPAAFNDFGGVIELVPADSRANRGVTLRVPYHGVVRPVARLSADVSEPRPRRPIGSVSVSNRRGPTAGSADLYAWGIEGEADDIGCNDVRAVGVQSLPYEGDDRVLVFAINGYRRCSSASVNEYDIIVTAENGDQYLVLGIDGGLLEIGDFTGQFATLVVNLTTGDATVMPAYAPTDSGMVYLYALASQIGLSPAAPRFSYFIESYDLFGLSPDDLPDGEGQFNAYDSALVGQGQFAALEPNTTTRLGLAVQRREWALTPAKGLMLVLAENPAGPAQADLFPFDGFR